MAADGLSRIRLLTGLSLAILSFCTFFAVIFVLLKSALLGADFLPANVLKIAFASFIVLIASHLLLKSKIVYWLVPAQAVAFAALIAGVVTVLTMAFENWQLLFSFDGLMGISSLAIGLTISLFANRLLDRYSPKNT